jgi:hypothetical protein
MFDAIRLFFSPTVEAVNEHPPRETTALCDACARRCCADQRWKTSATKVKRCDLCGASSVHVIEYGASMEDVAHAIDEPAP